MGNDWQTPEHALEYLRRADKIPHRTAGEETLLAELPADCRRVLDLGAGDGRLLGLVMLARPGATGVAVDFSPTMIVGGCPNGDPIAIDVANESGSVWYIDHETMSERPVREAAIRVARDASAMMQGLAERTFPIDYYDAAARGGRVV